MMQTRVIVNGAQGKMGRLACQTLIEHPEFQLVAELGKHDRLEDYILKTNAQIVIDLTRADCVYENTLTIIQHGAHPVIGTTGLVEQQIQTLRQLCSQKQWGGLIIPNFSIAAVLMMRMAKLAARFLPDVEIIEAHHPQKLDAPSGTALKTAEMIAETRNSTTHKPLIKEIVPHPRGAIHQNIHIHALRLSGVLAEQQVIFGNLGETLTITHRSIDRMAFMPGLILACQRVQQLDGLYYGLEHLLEQ